MLKAILLLVIIAPNGNYKDFLLHQESMEVCVANKPEWRKRVVEEFPRGTTYVLECMPVRVVGETAS